MLDTLPVGVVLGEVVPLLGLVDAWLLTRLTPKLVAPWASSDSASFRQFLLAMREREFGMTADEALARALALGEGLPAFRATDARGAVTWRGPRDETALHRLCYDADLPKRDATGATPAAHLRALVVLGANPNATDARANTALHALVESGNALAFAAPSSAPGRARRRESARDALRTLRAAGADVNAARASDGWTPLHLAAATAFPDGSKGARGLAARSRELIAALLDLGADPERRNRFGETPADCAGGLAGKAVRAAIRELAPAR